MEWIIAFALIFIAAGTLITAREVQKIREVLSGTRPLPWTALVEIQKRVAAGDDSALEAVEALMAQRGPATVGDWLADSACAAILRSLMELAPQAAGEGKAPSTRRRTAGADQRPQAKANGKESLGDSALLLAAPASFTRGARSREA